jgi:hypothetical protein
MKFYGVLRIVDVLESSARPARVRSPQQVFGYLSDSARIDESTGRGARVVTTAVPPSASVRKPRFRLMPQLAFRVCVTLRNCLLAPVAFHSSSFCYSLMIVHNFDVMRTIVVPSKQIRHWPFIRILYCPALLADNFPTIRGLAATSPRFTGVSNIISLRSAALLKPENCLTFSPPKKSSSSSP